MTELDDKLLPVALELINKFGKDMTYTVVTTEGTYDPATRSKTGEVSTIYPGVKSAPPFDYETKDIDGTLIKRGDLKTIVAAKDAVFTPAQNMFVEFDGIKFAATTIKPYYSGDLIAAWEIRLRNLNG